MASGIYACIMEFLLDYMSDTIAGRALGYCAIAMPLLIVTVQFAVLVKSEKMARLFIALSRDMDFDHVKYRMSVTEGVAITISAIYFPFFVVYFSSLSMGYAEKIMNSFFIGHYYLHILTYTCSLTQAYSLLSKKLQDAVSQAVPPPPALGHRIKGSENREAHEDSSVLTSSLNKLEKDICNVRNISISHCFM